MTTTQQWDGAERRKHDTPCIQEEPIKSLFMFHNEKIKQLTEMEKRQIIIGADVAYIKSRIDNGLSSTVENMHMNLVKIIPVIDRHTALEKRIEDWFWAGVKALTTALVITILGIAIWALMNGWKP